MEGIGDSYDATPSQVCRHRTLMSVVLPEQRCGEMAVNHQHLRAFHAVATDGSVSRAARRLNVAQPTLSQQLKALEERHQTPLFEGRKPPLRLTAAGRQLFTLTQKLFATSDDIDDLLGDGNDLTLGAVRMGSDCPIYAARRAG